MASGYASICFSGDFGTGKTYGMVRQSLLDPHKRIWAPKSMKLNLPDDYTVDYFDHPSELLYATHGTAIIDEADLYFDSRSQGPMDIQFKKAMKQARKRHLKVLYGVQHYGSLKKENRQYVGEVRVCDRFSVPMLPFFCPTSRRAEYRCEYGVLSDDQTGDRWGFGTVFLWRSYPPALIRDDESMASDDVKANEKVPMLGWGLYPFDLKIGQAYNTREEIK